MVTAWSSKKTAVVSQDGRSLCLTDSSTRGVCNLKISTLLSVTISNVVFLNVDADVPS